MHSAFEPQPATGVSTGTGVPKDTGQFGAVNRAGDIPRVARRVMVEMIVIDGFAAIPGLQASPAPVLDSEQRIGEQG